MHLLTKSLIHPALKHVPEGSRRAAITTMSIQARQELLQSAAGFIDLDVTEEGEGATITATLPVMTAAELTRGRLYAREVERGDLTHAHALAALFLRADDSTEVPAEYRERTVTVQNGGALTVELFPTEIRVGAQGWGTRETITLPRPADLLRLTSLHIQMPGGQVIVPITWQARPTTISGQDYLLITATGTDA